MSAKVLFIGHDAWRTGAPLLLLHFLRWLKKNSHLQFALLLRSGGDLVPEYRELGNVRILGVDLFSPPRNLLPRAWRRFQRGAGWQPASILNCAFPVSEFPLVYSNTITNASVTSELAVQGRRFICHVHELDHSVEHYGGIEPLKPMLATTDCFIGASLAVSSFLERKLTVLPSRIRTIYEFAVALEPDGDGREAVRHAARKALGISTDALVVGMCGDALDYRKGAEMFMQLAIHLKRLLGGSPFKLVWVGHTGTGEKLRVELARAGLEDTVLFAGKTPKPGKLYPAFDIFALTSREDPFSVAMLEAAACGLPVVCFAGSGGGPEFVEDNAGFTVPYLDVPAMAKSCALLWENAGLRSQMARNAAQKVRERFTIDTIAPQLCGVIEEQLTATNGRH